MSYAMVTAANSDLQEEENKVDPDTVEEEKKKFAVNAKKPVYRQYQVSDFL